MVEDLPVRKQLRLKDYDYSQNGVYFVTVCIKDRHDLLGNIKGGGDAIVGDAVLSVPNPPRALQLPTPPHLELSEMGKLVEDYLANMNSVNESLQLDTYVIMPNHVHLLITITAGAIRRHETMQTPGTLRTASPTKGTPTKGTSTMADPARALIPQIVHGLKSFTTRRIGESIWQRSYHDHIVRNDEEHKKIWDYIDTNIQNWQTDSLYNI